MLKQLILSATLSLGLVSAVSAAPAVWEVSDSDSKVWLFGSVHILPPNTRWRTPLFDETLKGAETVYFEADIGPLGIIGATIKMVTLGLQGPATPWTDRLTTDERKQLADAVEPLGFTVDTIGRFPPWIASQQIAAQLMDKQGFKADSGVDPGLEAELPKERKAYFETAAWQIGLLAGGSEDEQVQQLLDALPTLKDSGQKLNEMVDTWMKGNVDELAGAVDDDPDIANPAIKQKLLLDRNAKWVPTIEGLLRDNHLDLIVVGAAHLAGDGSVIDLLGKAGYSVKRIQ